jgi:hypothetical protein
MLVVSVYWLVIRDLILVEDQIELRVGSAFRKMNQLPYVILKLWKLKVQKYKK